MAGERVNAWMEWWTDIPHRNQRMITLSTFSIGGTEWKLQFWYQYSTRRFKGYHVITLHPADSRWSSVLLPQPQEEEFGVRCFLTNPRKVTGGGEMIYGVTHDGYQRPFFNKEFILWSGGTTEDSILEKVTWLQYCKSVKLVCMFDNLHPSMIVTDENNVLKTSQSVSTERPSDLGCLSRDFGRLLADGQLPDVRLNCEGETFPGHRAILAARSEVFAAMFRNNMTESETGGVEIKDIDPNVFRHFLQYVYTGKLPAGSGNVIASLYAAADRYDVDSLRGACTRWIVGSLTEENCVEYLTVADLHGIGALKEEVIAFICGQPAVMLRKDWEELTMSHPGLTLEVHQNFVRSKTKA